MLLSLDAAIQDLGNHRCYHVGLDLVSRHRVFSRAVHLKMLQLAAGKTQSEMPLDIR